MSQRKIIDNLVRHLGFLGYFYNNSSVNTGTSIKYHAELIPDLDEYFGCGDICDIYRGYGDSEEEALIKAVCNMPKRFRKDF